MNLVPVAGDSASNTHDIVFRQHTTYTHYVKAEQCAKYEYLCCTVFVNVLQGVIDIWASKSSCGLADDSGQLLMRAVA